MIAPENHPEESERLQALHRLCLLDTGPEPIFHEIVAVAAAVCRTPIALMTLVDEDRQWFKASIGLSTQSTPRDISFCGHAILQTGLFVVPDASTDSRFCDNPMVTSDPHIRFYAGVTLHAEGRPVGTLGVIDNVERHLTNEQIAVLRLLASHVEHLFRLRVQALRASDADSEARLVTDRQAQVLDALPVAVLGCDKSGRVTVLNRAFSLFFPDVQVGQPIDGLRRHVLSQDGVILPIGQRPIYRALGGENVRFRGLALQTARGELLLEGTAAPVYRAGVVTSAIAAFRDATAELLAERAIASHEAELSDLFENAADLIQFMDGAGRFIHVNRAWREALGYSEQDVQGLTFRDVVHPDSLAHCEEIMASMGSTSVLVETAFRSKSGMTILVEGHSRRSVSTGGEVRFRGLFRNVTARKKREQEMRQAFAEATEASRVRAQFLSRMNHELRTPLNAILGFAQLLTMERLNQESLEFANQILSSGQDLLHKVDQLLALSDQVPASTVSPAAAVPRVVRKVLHIEDRVDDQRLVEGVLALRPSLRLVSMMTVPDPFDAARDLSPHLILLGLGFAQGAAENLLMRFKGDPTLSGVPVIALGSDASPAQAERLTSMGVVDYMTKPLAVDRLLSRIDSLNEAGWDGALAR